MKSSLGLARRKFVATSMLLLGLMVVVPTPPTLSVGPLVFPDGSTTGPIDESKVPPSPQDHIRTSMDGQVIENVHTDHITIQHDNVTVRNFRVTIDNPNTSFGIKLVQNLDGGWPKNTVVEYGEIISRDSSGNPQPSRAKGVTNGRNNIVIRGLEISYTEDGLHCGAGNCLFEDNYIHDLIKFEDAHNDGIVVSGGSNVVIRHNTVLLPNQQTGAVSIFPDSSPIDDVLVEDNYLNGGSYTVYSRTMDHGTPTNVRFIGNHFGRDYNAGTHSFDGDVVFLNNVWADTGQPLGDSNSDDGGEPGGRTSTIGLVDPSTGSWRLYDHNGGLVAHFLFGNPGDTPFLGDWDCDGIETPGLYRRSDGFVYLRNANTQGVADMQFFFGNPGDIPLVGDFNGDGCDTVSIYRPSEGRVFIINRLGADDGRLGAAELNYYFGNPGDKPFVGDFDGNGTETVGLHRESTGFVYFRLTHTEGASNSQFYFGDPGDQLIAGDWTGNGVYTPALFRSSSTTLFYRFTNTEGNADHNWVGGQAGWIPVAGYTG